MKMISKGLIVFTTTSLMLGACGKETKKQSTTEDNTTTPIDTPKLQKKSESIAKAAAASTDTSFAAGMMTSYEECRALLAADTSEGVSNCAMAIVEASRSAHVKAPKAAHEPIGSVVKAAEALATLGTDDIEAQRLGFGELSRATVAMLTAAPVVAKNYHLFECPMAKGYKRWAQPGATLENPYMGKKMLTCGTEVHDHHKGIKEEVPGHGNHKH